MFIGTCFNEFPLSTSEDMTQTFNGEVVEYDISIDQQVLKDLLIKQKKSHSVYIKMEELFITDKTSKLEK